MTKIFFALLLLALPLLFSNSVDAQSRSYYMSDYDRFKITTRGCATIVKRQYGEGNFNAFVTEDGRIRMSGTEQEKFAFEKCMSESGFGIEFQSGDK
jgi:hypothetical protein